MVMDNFLIKGKKSKKTKAISMFFLLKFSEIRVKALKKNRISILKTLESPISELKLAVKFFKILQS